MVGHSLGGALASLLGVTFGTPTVTIESPGEKMAAGRLHLPSPVCNPIQSSSLHPYLTQHAARTAPRHARIPHRRPYRHGHLQRRAVLLRSGRLRDGEQVPPRQVHRVRHGIKPFVVGRHTHAHDRERDREAARESLAAEPRGGQGGPRGGGGG